MVFYQKLIGELTTRNIMKFLVILSILLSSFTLVVNHNDKRDIAVEVVAPHVHSLTSINPFTLESYKVCSSFTVEYLDRVFHVTNKHCCNAADMYYDNKLRKPIHISATNDLCALEHNFTEGLELADKDVEVTNKIYILGYPKSNDLTITEGRLSRKSVEIFGENMSLTTAKTDRGGSGGVVTNAFGKVVGVLAVGDQSGNGGFVTLPNLKIFLEEIFFNELLPKK
jgi:hypothetical protein